MANTIDKQTIIDGSKKLIVKIFFASDGVTGELSDYVLIDASTYSPAFTDCTIKMVHSELSGFTAKLIFAGATPANALHIPDYEAHYNSKEIGYFGGIPNNAVTPTGDILLTTTGFTAAGDQGTIIIELEKN